MSEMQYKELLWICMVVYMCGCSNVGLMTETLTATPGDPKFAPVPSDSLVPTPGSDGSLFTDIYGMSLYGDKKARRIGDIITIVLSENTQGSKSSATNTSKSSNTNLTAPTLGIAGANPLASLGANLEGDRSFSGSGDADQSNSLSGNITVTVSDVLPNGILTVRGEKWITLNTGAEYIRIQGLLRPDDINLDNTVSSLKLADARITYSGAGAIANASKQGWLASFFNSAKFPF